MRSCKNCKSEVVVKNGFVRGLQRFKCRICGLNFVAGDKRINESVAVKKALAVILYSLSKASFRGLGKILGVSQTLVYRWIKSEADRLEKPKIANTIKEMEFDEMWHFVGSKKTKHGLSKQWIVAHGEPLHGLSAIVILQPSGYFISK